MAGTLLIVTGASSGIGHALAAHAHQAGAALATMSRRQGPGRHLRIDLSDPAGWADASAWIAEQVASDEWASVLMVHAAATLEPMGFAGEVPSGPYTSNVLLNSAAPQVLGHAFLSAMADRSADGVLALISSGAARSPYAGWSSYCAGKAACDQWVRAVGLEQSERGSRLKVVSIAPGVVATGMQDMIRDTDARDFPQVDRFRTLKEEGALGDPAAVAARLWDTITDPGLPTGGVLDLRRS